MKTLQNVRLSNFLTTSQNVRIAADQANKRIHYKAAKRKKMSINSWHLLHFHKLFLHMHSTILGMCNSNIRVIESNLLICPSLVTNWIWHESAYRKKSLTKTIAFIWWCLHNSSSAEVVVCRSGYSRPEFDCKKQFWRGFCSHSTHKSTSAELFFAADFGPWVTAT